LLGQANKFGEEDADPLRLSLDLWVKGLPNVGKSSFLYVLFPDQLLLHQELELITPSAFLRIF
jgi:tRNA U34 5-carboxymethylaminomethyl modifying GTPase MnmE/TrmE